MTIDSWCCRSAILPRLAARTPCSQTARASVPAKTRTKIASSRRIRRWACVFFIGEGLLGEIHVSVRRLVGRRQPELFRRTSLNLRGRELSRQVRLQRSVLRPQLRALGVRGIEGEVEPEHRHVHEYDAREQNPAYRDPEDSATRASLRALARPRLRLHLGGRRDAASRAAWALTRRCRSGSRVGTYSPAPACGGTA